MPFRSWYPVVFFLAFLVLGCWILDDYGISWDESIQRRHGRVSIDYAAEKLGFDNHIPLEPSWNLEDYQWSNYGMIYQITANLLEQQLDIEDNPYRYYQLRHYLCFGLFWLATIFFYRGLRIRFPDKAWYPLIGTLALILSPRIFANGFYNPKDHILLAFYVISTTTLLRFLTQRTWKTLIFHALATGLVLNTRLPALVIPMTTVLILGWEMLRQRPFSLRNLGHIAAYLPLTILFLVPFFPYLWEDTFARLLGAFSEMSDFAWDSYVLLFGDRLHALNLPAYYIPAWIVITTPLLFVVLIFTGIYTTAKKIIRNLRGFQLWKTNDELLDFTQLGLALGPILVVILLGSTLYNGWRHLHFVYPSMVFLLMVGYDWAQTQVQGKLKSNGQPANVTHLPSLILALGLISASVQIVRYHPHQYVYFNAAIQGEPLNLRFDMDYWGVGFREAFLQLADQIPEGETRSVKCDSVWPCKDNLKSLPPEARAKIKLEDAWHKADYLATNFIWDNTRYAVRDRKEHFAFPLVEIRPAGHLTIGIYNLKYEKKGRENQ